MSPENMDSRAAGKLHQGNLTGSKVKRTMAALSPTCRDPPDDPAVAGSPTKMSIMIANWGQRRSTKSAFLANGRFGIPIPWFSLDICRGHACT
jgi:hypothetical protein